MARALALKDNASPDERENVKWQTLQVSTLSIASCIGRILIGICPSGVPLCRDGSDFLPDRCDCRLCKTQRDKTRSMHRYSGIVVSHLSVGWHWCSGHQSPAICGYLGWDLVRWGVRPLTDHYHRMVRNGYVVVRFSWNLPQELIRPSESTHTYTFVESLRAAHFSENWGLVSVSPLVAGNIFSMTFGRIYDAHSSYGEHGLRCLQGARCYSASLYVTTLACICALILAFVAAKRDRRYG